MLNEAIANVGIALSKGLRHIRRIAAEYNQRASGLSKGSRQNQFASLLRQASQTQMLRAKRSAPSDKIVDDLVEKREIADGLLLCLSMGQHNTSVSRSGALRIAGLQEIEQQST